MSWEKDKAWSDQFIPEIKRHLGWGLISTATWEQDAKEATDLIVLELASFRVGCRIRRYEHLQSYGGEFTIRFSRDSGCATEMTKLVDGWGTHIFYGFANADGLGLAQWFIGNLDVWRGALIRTPALARREPIRNADGSSSFLAWKVSEFPPAFVVASDRGVRQ